MMQVRDIVLLEQLAHSTQNALNELERGIARDRLVARLARLDQIIAGRKDKAGTLGCDVCSYLEG
jgi:hypothetical protein